jgi:hypothetical protein
MKDEGRKPIFTAEAQSLNLFYLRVEIMVFLLAEVPYSDF